MNWTPGAHASTFGGNPVSVAAALATLDLLEEGLMENARRIGERLLKRLSAWPGRFRQVGDVRGLGLMIGIEMVRDPESRQRNPDARDRLVNLAFERGLLVLGAGPNTVRLSPPLLINEAQADFAADTLEGCLRTMEA
jgi:4-aminobutyrate aminotransferase